MNIQWILMSIDEYFALGKIEDGRKKLSCYERLKVSPFVKFEMIQSVLCWLLDHNEIQQGWILNFLYRFKYISVESFCQEEEGTITNYSFQEKMC